MRIILNIYLIYFREEGRKAESRKANSITEVCLHDLPVGNLKTVMTALKQRSNTLKKNKNITEPTEKEVQWNKTERKNPESPQ